MITTVRFGKAVFGSGTVFSAFQRPNPARYFGVLAAPFGSTARISDSSLLSPDVRNALKPCSATVASVAEHKRYRPAVEFTT